MPSTDSESKNIRNCHADLQFKQDKMFFDKSNDVMLMSKSVYARLLPEDNSGSTQILDLNWRARRHDRRNPRELSFIFIIRQYERNPSFQGTFHPPESSEKRPNLPPTCNIIIRAKRRLRRASSKPSISQIYNAERTLLYNIERAGAT